MLVSFKIFGIQRDYIMIKNGAHDHIGAHVFCTISQQYFGRHFLIEAQETNIIICACKVAAVCDVTNLQYKFEL